VHAAQINPHNRLRFAAEANSLRSKIKNRYSPIKTEANSTLPEGIRAKFAADVSF
jgi:hypothetical protein